jgi:transposase
MLKTKTILQMLGNGVSQSKICQEVHCSKRMVSNVKKKTDDTGLGYGELLQLSDSELQNIFSPSDTSDSEDVRKSELKRLMPSIVARLGRKHATVQFVFEDYYRKVCPDGYGYTQFNKYVSEFRKENDYSYHNAYTPGEEWQIDFAGDALYLTDRLTKAKQKLTVLVCIMPYSNLPFMMALPNATTEWFFHGLNKGLEYLGALPKIAKSDNMKQWVTKSERFSPTFSDANLEWASFYGIEPTACRVRKPRDKGPVESAVNQLYNYVYARLEGEEFYTLDAINDRILTYLDEYCSKPYKGSSRREIFEKYEKPKMAPLPDTMFRFRNRKQVKLSASYHVCVGRERHFYSVPYKYVGQTVKVMWNVETVEVFVADELVCAHRRSLVPYGYSTEKTHMPDSHLAYERRKEVNAAKLIEWGANIGSSVKWAIEDLLQTTTFPQQAYQRCSSILALAKRFSRQRLETACRMLKEEGGAVTYKALESILKNKRDIKEGTHIVSTLPLNPNVRGAKAYQSVALDRKEGEDGQK